jgi:DNA-binding CsgD family transcriptional regulator
MNTTSRLRPVSVVASARSPDDQQRLSDLIGVIYDAAIDPSLWEGAIERAAYFIGGSGAALINKDVGARNAVSQHEFGFQRLPVALFEPIYPAAEPHFLGDIGQPIATTDLIPFSELRETELYRQWAQPQGIVDFISAVLDRTTISSAIFGVFRHERNGLVDDRARRQMRLIAPHIRRAVLIGRMFEFKAGEVATFVDALDGLSAGMYLVDAEGRLIHANAAGRTILAAGDILSSAGGRLVASDTRVQRTLRDVFAAAGQGDAAVGIKGIAVSLIGKDDERYVAHALPLTSGARRRAGIDRAAAAALFVRRASQVIGETFKLTPTELRVLLAITEVGGIPEVATAFGVADTTVRTHVNRLFQKTGATRQVDLVKLVAGYTTPLAG